MSALDVDEDLEHERRDWAAQTAGWSFFALVLLAGALGLLGEGPMSMASVDSPESGLSVEYERVVRHNAEGIMRVTIRPEPGAERARLLIGKGWLEKVRVEHLEPDPASVKATAEGLEYSFQTDGSPVPAAFHVQFTGFARLPVRLSSGERPPLELSQFIVP